MATIRPNTVKLDYEDIKTYIVDGPLTRSDVDKINRLSTKAILIMPNTKGQSASIISSITNPNVRISVYGGLDYFKKKKFNDWDYIDRTLYSPKELAKIIEYFENIEKDINPAWDETTKCMFIYKALCETNHYLNTGESPRENNKDVVRSLKGVLYGKLVCSGFALTLKEMLDRNGIECYYQNVQCHHSWVIAKLDGAYRGLELTWDCYNKKNNTCGFAEFGRDENFYKNKHHDISHEKEETPFPLVPYKTEELTERYSRLMGSSNTLSFSGQELENAEGQKVRYVQVSKKDGKYNNFLVCINNKIYCVSLDKSRTNYRTLFLEAHLQFAEQFNNGYLLVMPDKTERRFSNKFTRDDGSTFVIHEASDSVYEKQGVHKYWYVEIDKDKMTRHAIYSENDLINVPESARAMVANRLLSKERVDKKIAHYKGYVGYISMKSRTVHYDSTFEEQLQITARK